MLLPNGAHVTDRQLDVARGVIDGLSNQQIADRLFVSIDTVKTLLQRVARATGGKTRVAVAAYLLTNDVLPYPEYALAVRQPTIKQLQAINLLASGLTFPEIAKRFCVSDRTVKKSVRDAARIMGLTGNAVLSKDEFESVRTKVAVAALRQGWIGPRESEVWARREDEWKVRPDWLPEHVVTESVDDALFICLPDGSLMPMPTRAEFQVMQGLAQALSNAGIAAQNFTSPETVKTHMQHITAKLGANRTQAMSMILAAGLAPFPSDPVCDRPTQRELEVLEALREGLSVDEAANVLGISKWTVKGHVSGIKERAGIEQRTSLTTSPELVSADFLVAIALREGWIKSYGYKPPVVHVQVSPQEGRARAFVVARYESTAISSERMEVLRSAASRFFKTRNVVRQAVLAEQRGWIEAPSASRSRDELTDHQLLVLEMYALSEDVAGDLTRAGISSAVASTTITKLAAEMGLPRANPAAVVLGARQCGYLDHVYDETLGWMKPAAETVREVQPSLTAAPRHVADLGL